MSEQLTITRVDFMNGELVIVDLSDGTTLQITLEQLLSLKAIRTAPES